MTLYEIIDNGDFEIGNLNSWSIFGYAHADTNTKHSGVYSAHMYLAYGSYQGNDSGIYQSFVEPIAQDKITSFGFWGYANLNGFDRAKFVIYFSDSTNISVDISPSSWTYFDLLPYVPVGKSVSAVSFHCYTLTIFSYGSSLNVDDISVQATQTADIANFNIDYRMIKTWDSRTVSIDVILKPSPIVRVDSLLPDFIIEFNKKDISYVQLPQWLNTLESMNEKFYNRMLIQVSYKFRVSDADKWEFDKKLRNHQYVLLNDGVHNIYGDAYLTRLEGEWTSGNFEREWIVTITLVLKP